MAQNFEDALEKYLPGITQEQKDLFITKHMEGQEVAASLAASSRQKGFTLGVQHEGQVFVHADALTNLVLAVTPGIVTNTATYDDFKRVVIAIADLVSGAEAYVASEVDSTS